MSIIDTYYKKTIEYVYLDRKLSFKVSQSLFSSHIIDLGTQRLLRTFLNNKSHFDKLLDLGCGYGPIGITLKVMNPTSEVHLTDRDALALEYSRANAGLNDIDNLQIYGSLGYDEIGVNDFDLIISNIPAKVGRKVLQHLLRDSKYFLSQGGLVAIVVVDAILDEVREILSNPDIEIILEKSWNGHTVFHYKFVNTPLTSDTQGLQSFKTGLYDRTESILHLFGKSATLKTTYNLPEFDEISRDTQLLLNNLEDLKDKNIASCAVYNVRQGHVPVALAMVVQTQKMIIIDRNLQSLKATSRNLVTNGYEGARIISKHQVGLDLDSAEVDYIFAVLDRKEGTKENMIIIDQIIDQLKVGGIVYLTSSSNLITQVEKIIKKNKHLLVLKRMRNKGGSFLSFKMNSN